ncbi:unnamed protein product [Dibothriocephalus latus]|uniref:Uncharacterized protein n=1 Tax=Dibothriocephalus latus TaxID=60516 RepID=A0A3P6PPS5_DIBLA|nr:unnamed protein product [Dibothriocephalus latus]
MYQLSLRLECPRPIPSAIPPVPPPTFHRLSQSKKSAAYSLLGRKGDDNLAQMPRANTTKVIICQEQKMHDAGLRHGDAVGASGSEISQAVKEGNAGGGWGAVNFDSGF